MKKPVIAVFGGSQEATFRKLGVKFNCEVLHHTGKTRNGGNKKEFRNIIKKADSVVVLLGACGHVSMDIVKEVCKKLDKNIEFVNGFGATGAIQKGLEVVGIRVEAA
ncbi:MULTISPECIES: DUF2325 domain-containing protein [Metabacillus]|uniref:DUF2325 domain-containing protein n=1 Tax=Metabacillus TaxID=2675233 RepID=UPI000C7FFB99|nr:MULTISPECIES: DUF2325 domain-containing protein [Metabacillus]MCM3443964.1 DUF2325 domain-containing protein [Metabacillus halosaccharovorans]PMC34984.1 DUF2325 domain-containing protein [Bacillus sp. UMB0899]